MNRGTRLVFITLALVIAAASFAYWRSDIVAPLFVSAEGCGPLQVRVESINLSAGGQRLRRSFPVDDGGAPDEERYMNAVAGHVAAAVQSHTSLSPEGTPFQLDMLFVENDIGLVAGSEFDQHLTRPRLVSPWVRVLKSDWFPCSMQVVSFRQGRQMARDQLEMQAGRALEWQGSTELSLADINGYAEEYVRRVLVPLTRGPRDDQIRLMSRTFPPEVLFAFMNSPQATIHSPNLGFDRIVRDNPDGYANHTNNVIDVFFRSPDQYQALGSVLETDYQQSGYKNNSLQRYY